MDGAGLVGASPALSDEDLDHLAARLKPLSNPTRLRILRFLTIPRFLEEIADHLKVTRQAARKHLDQLLGIGAIERQPGARGAGHVVHYLTNPQALFMIHDQFEKLGNLSPPEPPAGMARTRHAPGRSDLPAERGGVSLTVVRGMLAGRSFRLGAPAGAEWTLGRDARCEIVLPYDPWVSNRHAIIRHEAGTFALTDLRSTNGTQHNGEPIPRGGRVELSHGDILGIGRSTLVYWNR